MQIAQVKIYLLLSLLIGVILLGSCTGGPRHAQIAQSEGLTLEEKIQELVYRGASRTEVVATFGESTGYTNKTLSYTVLVFGNRGQATKMQFPALDMDYADPGHPGDYRWILTFDERGILYNYHRVAIEHSETARVYDYLRDEMGGIGAAEWHAAYRTGFDALECTDTKHCWAVGGAGLILETTDGGKSWVSHASGVDRYRRSRWSVPTLYSVAFADSLNGWLTGHDSGMTVGGFILRSLDGGENWAFQLKSDSMWHPRHGLWDIASSSDGQVWAVGGKGTILHTDDGGKTWTNQPSGTKAALLSVEFCDEQRGWAVGSSWTILHTSDAGRSWQSQVLRSDQLPIRAPEAKPFPWPRYLSVYPYEDVLTSVSFIDCRQGWIAGDHGAILHTEDGGETWLAQVSGTRERLNAVQFVSPQLGWAAGDRGVILKTTDGGKEWMTQSSETREDLRDLNFVDTDHGWIGGSYGTLLNTSDGGMTWAKQCLVYDCAGKAAQQFYWHPWLK